MPHASAPEFDDIPLAGEPPRETGRNLRWIGGVMCLTSAGAVLALALLLAVQFLPPVSQEQAAEGLDTIAPAAGPHSSERSPP